MRLKAFYKDDPVTIIAFMPYSSHISPVIVLFYYDITGQNELDYSTELNKFIIYDEGDEFNGQN
jgi:hypothetical protein